MFLFILFYRTTFGVEKASVCFREAATIFFFFLTKQDKYTAKKGMSIQLQQQQICCDGHNQKSNLEDQIVKFISGVHAYYYCYIILKLH